MKLAIVHNWTQLSVDGQFLLAIFVPLKLIADYTD